MPVSVAASFVVKNVCSTTNSIYTRTAQRRVIDGRSENAADYECDFRWSVDWPDYRLIAWQQAGESSG